MLILTRRRGESIRLGDDIVVTVTALSPTQVRLGIEAPRSVRVSRIDPVDTPASTPSQLPPKEPE